MYGTCMKKDKPPIYIMYIPSMTERLPLIANRYRTNHSSPHPFFTKAYPCLVKHWTLSRQTQAFVMSDTSLCHDRHKPLSRQI